MAEKIMEQINCGKIKMKPIGYFIIKAITLSVFVALLVLLDIFLVSFSFFALKTAGVSWFLLLVVFFVLCFIGISWFLIEKFPSFYRKPFVVGLVVLLIIVSLLSFLVLETDFHKTMLKKSGSKNIPIITPLYKYGCGCGCQK